MGICVQNVTLVRANNLGLVWRDADGMGMVTYTNLATGVAYHLHFPI
jgi:hypothetical protein